MKLPLMGRPGKLWTSCPRLHAYTVNPRLRKYISERLRFCGHPTLRRTPLFWGLQQVVESGVDIQPTLRPQTTCKPP